MNKHIIITPEQAELIRGKHGKYSRIEPVILPDGNYIVPEACINDPDLISVKNTLNSMRGKEQEIKEIKDTETIQEGTIATAADGLVMCVDEVKQLFSYDLNLPAKAAKTVLVDPDLMTEKEVVKAQTNDADTNIKKLSGNILNYIADLTDGVRTPATDAEVEQLINDGNIIITVET
jgi:hypothetical protein